MCYADTVTNDDGTATASCNCGWSENHATPKAAATAAQLHQTAMARAAARAGHDHGWIHADEWLNLHGEGGLYAEPVVPQHFAAVASWYTAAYAHGIVGFFVHTGTCPPA